MSEPGDLDIAEVVEGGGPSWRPGATVGRYYLLTKLAVGGMAEIWLARQEGLKGFEKLVVIKRIADRLSGDPEFVEMFLDEARIAAQLNHPNIVQLYDLGESEGAYYIAMEYLPGENLAAVVRAGLKANRPLPLSYAVRIVASAAEGLGHAHTQVGTDGKPMDVVHRDVSPQNIIVTYGGLVKVVDFGIAKAANRGSGTGKGQLKGKMSYLSPEQARGQAVDARSDVFALGIILYELVTRSRLFQFDEPLAAIRAITAETPVPPARSRSQEVPPELDQVLTRALAKNPSSRYPTARNFQVALEAWLRKTDDAPGTAELAAYVSALFKEQMADRARLVESARSGELTPSRARRVIHAEAGDSSKSLPGATTGEALAAPRRRRWRWIAGAAAAAAAAALALVASGKITSGEPRAQVVAAPAPAPVEVKPPPAKVAAAPEPPPEPPPSKVAATPEPPPEPPPSKVAAAPAPVEVKPSAPEPPPSKVAAAPAPAPKAAEPKRRAPSGRLSLDTVPWTRVYRGGKPLGDTPLIDVPLPAGRQVLKLVNEDKGISTTIEVVIEPGKSTAKKLKL
ncbi:MAG TPA: serine/threonine-protein kinase [Myxococcales bacterium]|nr:serine/threonine-protein kinase [Myxococcales bacterium]